MRSFRVPALFHVLVLGAALLAQIPPPPPPPPAPPAPPAPLAAAEGAWGGSTRVENRTERLAYGSRLWVRNRNGNITVSGWDKEEVVLRAEIRDTEKRPIQLVVQRKGADLDIEALYEQPKWTLSFGFTPSPRCQMTLQVPRRLQGHFRTTNGGVEVSNLEGYARCETTNGNINLSDIAGEALADTTNGTVKALRLKARIKGGTTNGRIFLENVEGGIKMETTNGNITARGLDGWGEGIRLETTNGSIDVELGKATGDLVADNSHGSLDVKVPGARVVEADKHTVRLKIPGKAQKITLDTTNGSITVR
jgi:DUF4097 and DUF4098 domain-containing protein YvlB